MLVREAQLAHPLLGRQLGGGVAWIKDVERHLALLPAALLPRVGAPAPDNAAPLCGRACQLRR
jgi:hypothetical protein